METGDYSTNAFEGVYFLTTDSQRVYGDITPILVPSCGVYFLTTDSQRVYGDPALSLLSSPVLNFLTTDSQRVYGDGTDV